MFMPTGVPTKKKKKMREERSSVKINAFNTANMKQWIRNGQTGADYVNNIVALQHIKNLEKKELEMYKRMGESGLFYENIELKKQLKFHKKFWGKIVKVKHNSLS